MKPRHETNERTTRKERMANNPRLQAVIRETPSRAASRDMPAQATPEQVARMLQQGFKRKARLALEIHPEPGLFALQVGLALGILIDNPLNGYHQLRKFLSEKPRPQ